MLRGRTRSLAQVVVALAFVVALSLTVLVDAQSPPPRRVGVQWVDGVARVSVSARDLASSEVRRKLMSGLPQTTVLRVYQYVDGGREPMAAEVVSCRIVYDLWQEIFRVERATGRADHVLSLRRIEDVIDSCLVVRDRPIGDPQRTRSLSRRKIYFAVLVEFNPMNPATVTRIRRWLAQPAGRRADEAFFGSFVSLFVSERLGQAERTLRFRSQLVTAP